jgi:DNA polymerase III subunit epsilon
MQRSFDDLGESLASVTFVVLDLETTGASPETCAITEVGAVKLRGGECLGRFQTLVNPGVPIPPDITYLTGITEAMVIPAPRIARVLPALLEFIAGAVIVGHNVRFDTSFIRAASNREGYPGLGNRAVDTCALARRLVPDEVPDCRLATLAAHFRTTRRPTHRALDDAEATGEVLHALLERAGSLGVLALEDLVELPSVKHPQLAKLKLTNRLPRRPGVYVFRDAGGRALYVGKAINLRRRVRSYFAGEGDDRKAGPLLGELAAVDDVICSGELEASVLEIRMINELSPRYNRQGRMWRRYAYLKLALNERRPRLAVVRSPRPGDGCVYLGPLASAGSARLIAEAIEAVAPLDVAVLGLTVDPDLLLVPLQRRVSALAAAQRFEEATALSDGARALSGAIARQQRLDTLRGAGRLTVEVPGEGGAVLQGGRLVAAWPEGGQPGGLTGPASATGVAGPLPRELADEVACVAAWLDARAGRLRLVET